jgi:hypothetical protein
VGVAWSVLGLGCASRPAVVDVVQPGLANVQAMPLDMASVPPGMAVVTPLQIPREAAPVRPTFPFRRPSTAAPPPSLWSLHLHGLPPCDGDAAREQAKEVEVAVCSLE